MKRFAFRFERFLTLRRAEEQKKLKQFAGEQQRLEQERVRLQLFETERDVQLRSMRDAMLRPFVAGARGVDWKYLGRLERVREYQRGRVEEQSAATDRARQVFLEARRGVKSLEQLKETKRAEWWADAMNQEQKLLDDLPHKPFDPINE